MKRSEYWAVESNIGKFMTLCPSKEVAEQNRATFDKAYPTLAPNRVVHLIEHTDALDTLIREAIANVDSVTSRDLREAILAVKEEVES